MTLKLSEEELAFLANVLDGIQLSGTPEQVRSTLALIDAIREKIRVASNEGKMT